MKNIKKSKKGGFTLIELLATITLLAVIAMISFVSVNAVIKNNKKTQYDNLMKSITVAARDYANDNKYETRSGNSLDVKLSVLVSDGYLTGPVIDPYTNEEIVDDNIKVIITFDGNNNVTNLKIENMPTHE